MELIKVLSKPVEAKGRLIFFPWAGGSSEQVNDFKTILPDFESI